MQGDAAIGLDRAQVSAMTEVYDNGVWSCHTHLEKFKGDFSVVPEGLKPYETLDIDGNILLTGGVSALIHRLLGGTAVGPFDNANAAIGVGDSTTNSSQEQVDLQASANKLRKAMDVSYPQHSDTAATASSKYFTMRSTFASADANWVWNEWGVFNSATNGVGRMLNRKVQNLGTKASGSTWQLTIQIAIN